MLCQDCPKKESCRELCEEAEAYVGQDYTAQRELTIGVPEPAPWPVQVSNVYLTKREREILTLLGRGLTRSDVCKVLEISKTNLRVHIRNMRRKINDFDI